MTRLGKYSKAIVAVLGAVASVLATVYSSASWEPPAVALIAAVGVFLVPNKQA
jgi:hypothetical protein